MVVTDSGDRLELLGPALMAHCPGAVREVDRICHRLGIEIGWHYILDLAWILQNLHCAPRSTILDAGAGNGAAQYVLAARGHNLISVDFRPRFVPLTAAMMFDISKLSEEEFTHKYIDHLQRKSMGSNTGVIRDRIRRLRLHDLALLWLPLMWAGRITRILERGKVLYYRADMRRMEMLDDESIDAVISVSAVEHMERDTIPAAVAEFERVLRPGGSIIVTTSAARDDDWFHEPSQGWCLSDRTLKEAFNLGGVSGFDPPTYDNVMKETRLATELQRRVPRSYRLSGDSGMPWGIWDPTYLPVGICKVKRRGREEG